jgi:hypothetical protein
VKEMTSTIAAAPGTGTVSADQSAQSAEVLTEKRLNSPKTREIEIFKIFEGGTALLGG